MRTGRLRSNMPGLRLVGEGSSGDAWKLSGLERVDSITLQTTQHHRLSELLSYLEREVATLESRFSEVCATLAIATARLAELGVIGIKPGPLTIDEEEEGK